MPRAKNLERYPSWFWALIHKAQNQPYLIETDKAEYIRFELYNFRLVLREKAQQDKSFLPQLNMANNLRFRLTPPGVIVHHVDHGKEIPNLNRLDDAGNFSEMSKKIL